MKRLEEEEALRVFDVSFAAIEARCFRDAKDLRRFKSMIWGKVKALHKVTHLDMEECVQIILQIVDKGCQNFYRLQYEDLMKYCDPATGDQPKREARARLSTWMYGHVTKKYNSLMTGFFAPIRAYDAGRVRTIVEEVVGIDTDGSTAKALAEGRVELKSYETLTVDANKVIRKKTAGTMGLSRYDVDDPACPVLTESGYSRQPDLVANLSEFIDAHKGVIQLIVSLRESDPCPTGLVESFGSVAKQYGLTTRDFMSAVRGLFGQNQCLQNV